MIHPLKCQPFQKNPPVAGLNSPRDVPWNPLPAWCCASSTKSDAASPSCGPAHTLTVWPDGSWGWLHVSSKPRKSGKKISQEELATKTTTTNQSHWGSFDIYSHVFFGRKATNGSAHSKNIRHITNCHYPWILDNRWRTYHENVFISGLNG